MDGRIATLVGYGPRPGSVTRRPRRTVTAAPAPMSQQGPLPPAQPQQGSLAPAQPQEGPLPPTQPQQGPLPPTRAGAGATSAAPPAAPPRPSGTVPLAKPPVRKLAKDLGVDLREVIPSRADGVITREDVQAHVNGTATRHGPAAEHAPVAASVAGERREPIRGVRRATAAAMVASAFTAPHVTEFLAVDVSETMALRDRLRATREYAEVRLTPLAVVAKAVCLAARRTPEVNAHWDEAAGEIVYYDHVQLGIAAATPRGLIVPKIRNADTLSLAQLAAALGELTATAREGRRHPQTSSAAPSRSPTSASSASTPAPRSSTPARRRSWPWGRSSRRRGWSRARWPCARCVSSRCRSTIAWSTASRAVASSPTLDACWRTRVLP